MAKAKPDLSDGQHASAEGEAAEFAWPGWSVPAGWRQVVLGELVRDVFSGGTPSTKRPEYWDGDVPWITSAYLGDALHVSEAPRYISREGLANSSARVVPAGSLLVGTRVGVGKVAVNLADVAISQDLTGVVLDGSRADVRFVAYALRGDTAQQAFRQGCRGTTIKGIPRRELLRIPVLLPPLPEQRAIADVLGTVQGAIEATERVIAAARELKRSLMRHLFTYGPVPPAEAERVRLKETEIGPLPEHWQVVRLGEMCERPQYGLTAAAAAAAPGPHLLRITDIQGDRVEWAAVPRCPCEPDQAARYALRVGDLLVARIGATTGKSYLVEECPKQAVFGSYLIRIRCGPRLFPSFLKQFTQSDRYWHQIDAFKGGKLKLGVNIPILQALMLPLPTLDEQAEISQTLQAVHGKIAAEEKRRAALEALFRSLLRELMTGRVRVTPHPFALLRAGCPPNVGG